MAGQSPELSIPSRPQARVAIISSSWHLDICDDLISGAKRALEEAGVAEINTIYVPGSFELPLAAQKSFEQGFDAAVVVGLVLKGETPWFWCCLCNSVGCLTRARTLSSCTYATLW